MDKVLHRRLFNPIEVITHAHIENEGFTFPLGPWIKHFFQQVQGKPGF